MTSKSMAKLRDAASRRQNGCCFYCGVRMLTASACGRRAERALVCTAEHLVPRSAGGADAADNIVAACWFCNTRRHRPRLPLPVLAYREHVQKRVEIGRWHSAIRGRRATAGRPDGAFSALSP